MFIFVFFRDILSEREMARLKELAGPIVSHCMCTHVDATCSYMYMYICICTCTCTLYMTCTCTLYMTCTCTLYMTCTCTYTMKYMTEHMLIECTVYIYSRRHNEVSIPFLLLFLFYCGVTVFVTVCHRSVLPCSVN